MQIIKNYVILGGGTAGWMTAAAMSHIFAQSDYTITLIESDDIGTVGVGEATIPQIVLYNKMLGIKEEDFLRETKATVKLGIEFIDWSRLGHNYFHPFGGFGVDMEAIQFHHFWVRHCKLKGHYDPKIYNVESMLAAEKRFDAKSVNAPSALRPTAYAYQFDAGLYAAFLRKLAEAKGVKRVEGIVTTVSRDAQSGHVTALNLKDGQTIEGDFFLDCSGFRGRLIEQEMHASYEDWSKWLPCDRAMAVPCEGTNPIPWTKATAREAGWQWRIPLQHRVGNGYVYASDFLSDEEAARLLLSRLDGKPLADPRPLRFKAGVRPEVWKGNVMAIGLASGFLEPLESTSIHLIQMAIMQFMVFLPTKGIVPSMVKKFNQLMVDRLIDIRDFLLLHYKASSRTDSEFWRAMQDVELTDSLKEKWSWWEETSMLHVKNEELFKESSWLAVFNGQEVMPKDYHPIADMISEEELDRRMGEIAKEVKRRVALNQPYNAHPSHITT